MGESDKGLPPLRRSKLSKKSQDKEDEIKKLYEDNKWWNDWKLQLHWHKLEWVNPRSQTKRNKSYSVSSNKFSLNKVDKTSHWVGHSSLKELDTIDFFERKHMIEDMEAELTESLEINSKTKNLAVTEEAYVD